MLLPRLLGFGKMPPGIQGIEIFSEGVGSSVPLHEITPVEVVDPLEVGACPHFPS